MDLDEYRRNSLDNWDRFAGNWADEHDFLWEATYPVGERMVEITYLEPRDQGKYVMLARTIAVDVTAVPDEFAEFMDSARDFLDQVLLMQRNPPAAAR